MELVIQDAYIALQVADRSGVKFPIIGKPIHPYC